MHMSPTRIRRANTRDAAAAAVRAMIVEGDLPDGERINEVRLAHRLDVSRTPLREALNRLVAERAIVARPRLGYFVRALTLEEFEQAYAIRPILDPEALRLAGVPPAERIDELDRLNRKLSAARDPAVALALDGEWHLTLLAHCPNRVLVELIEHMMVRTRRYELALFRETDNVMRASEGHASILSALRKGRLDQACASLRDNMQSAKEPIVAWLEARAASRIPRKRSDGRKRGDGT